MVNITPFRFKHMPLLLEMMESQKYEHTALISYRQLPKIGFIATNNEQPIAVGFLRRLEPCFAQIDTLVTNAYAGALLRHEGIDQIVDLLMNEAKRLKLQGIMANTRDISTITRAKARGFHVVPETILALSLQETSA